MKSLCLFSSYSATDKISEYIIVYLRELKKHYTDVVLLTNKRKIETSSLSKLDSLNITLELVANEGYDFGMWSKGLNKYYNNTYSEVALVNDSCILYNSLQPSLDKIRSSGWDYSGLISSLQVKWHIQSFFVVMKDTVIPEVISYFNEHGFKSTFTDVILTYEVGLCQHLLSRHYKLGAAYVIPGFKEDLNPSFMGMKELTAQGFPIIKRKLITGDYRNDELRGLVLGNFIFHPAYYINLVRNSPGEKVFDIEKYYKENVPASRQLKLLMLSSLALSIHKFIKTGQKVKRMLGIKPR